MWSAWVVYFLGIAYGITLVVGFASVASLSAPLPDPFLAIAELLFIVMAPAMVVMMAAIHAYAPHSGKTLSVTAFGFMILLAGLTTSVHFVELMVVRRIQPASVAGFSELFPFHWPSVLYALDIVAWDWFLGLALLFAAPLFSGGRIEASVRAGMIVSGALCLAGLVGPAIGDLNLRAIGIAGYAVVLPVVCLLLAVVFMLTPPASETLQQY
jgi:hypothetical protein